MQTSFMPHLSRAYSFGHVIQALAQFAGVDVLAFLLQQLLALRVQLVLQASVRVLANRIIHNALLGNNRMTHNALM